MIFQQFYATVQYYTSSPIIACKKLGNKKYQAVLEDGLEILYSETNSSYQYAWTVKDQHWLVESFELFICLAVLRNDILSRKLVEQLSKYHEELYPESLGLYSKYQRTD